VSVAAAVCNPSALPRAVRKASLGRDGGVRLTISRAGARAAAVADNPTSDSAPAIAQLVAEPLGRGDKLTIRGRVGRGTRVLVRFVSPDPIGLAGGDINLYGYAGSNPVGFRDPTGLSIFSDVRDVAEGGFQKVFGVDGVVDDVVPDSVSEAAAGELDGLTFGGASKLTGARCWDSDHYSIGRGFGAVGGAIFPAAGTSRALYGAGQLARRSSPIMQAKAGRAVSVLGGGAVGGAWETYAANGAETSSSSVVQSVGLSMAAGTFADGFRYPDMTPPTNKPATVSSSASGALSLNGRYDGC
jgi:hypothetical protein